MLVEEFAGHADAIHTPKQPAPTSGHCSKRTTASGATFRISSPASHLHRTIIDEPEKQSVCAYWTRSRKQSPRPKPTPLAAGMRLGAQYAMPDTPRPNSLDSFWMPSTPELAFRCRPAHGRGASAEVCTIMTPDGAISAALLAGPAGYGRPRIVEGHPTRCRRTRHATNFNLGHPVASEFANRLGEIPPSNSGPHLLHQQRQRSATLPPRQDCALPIKGGASPASIA